MQIIKNNMAFKLKKPQTIIITTLVATALILGSAGAWWYFGHFENEIKSQKSFHYQDYPLYQKNLSSNLISNKDQFFDQEFKLDSNTTVVNFDICEISLKLNQFKNIKAFTKDYKLNVFALIIIADTVIDQRNVRISETLICTKNKIIRENGIISTDATTSFISDIDSEIGRLTGIYASDLFFPKAKYSFGTFSKSDFSYDYKIYTNSKNLFYPIISSKQRDREQDPSLNYIKIINLSDLLNDKYDNSKDFKPESELRILGCENFLERNFDFDKCFIWNNQKNRLIALNDIENETIYLGKNLEDKAYIIAKATDICSNIYTVYEYNKESDQVVNTKIKIILNYCTKIKTASIKSTNCLDRDKGMEAKKCFKNSIDYEKYIVESNAELANNKKAQEILKQYQGDSN